MTGDRDAKWRQDKEILIKQMLFNMGIELRGLWWDWAEADEAIKELAQVANGDPKPRYRLSEAKMAARTPIAAKAALAAILALADGQVVFMNNRGLAKDALGLSRH